MRFTVLVFCKQTPLQLAATGTLKLVGEYRPRKNLAGHTRAMLINPFPNKPWFLRVCSISLLKTLWEEEKLLVTSNFSFSHSVFYSFGELSAILITHEVVVCKPFEIGGV